MLIKLFFILVSTLAHAGNDRGSGGGAVVCRDSHGAVTSAQLLEYYEAPYYAFTPEYAKETDSVVGKVGIILTRLQTVDPERAAKYFDWLNEFFDEAEFLPEGEFESTRDFGYVSLSNGCKIEQLAVQEEEGGEIRYWINKDLWKLIDNDGRAGLVLHELIYREMREHGHRNSILARLYGNFITSIFFNSETKRGSEFYRPNLEIYGLAGEARLAPVWASDDVLFDICVGRYFSFGLGDKVKSPVHRPIEIYPLWPGLPKYWDVGMGRFSGVSPYPEDVHFIMIARTGSSAQAVTLHLRTRDCN